MTTKLTLTNVSNFYKEILFLQDADISECKKLLSAVIARGNGAYTFERKAGDDLTKLIIIPYQVLISCTIQLEVVEDQSDQSDKHQAPF